MRKSKVREFFDAKTDIRILGVIARPTFRLSENNCAQNFAALQLRGLRLLLCGFGMERTLRSIGILPMKGHGLAARATGRDCRKRAMIGDREPGTDPH